MNLEQFHFIYLQIVHSFIAQLQLLNLAANSIRQSPTDEFQNNENLLVRIPQSANKEFKDSITGIVAARPLEWIAHFLPGDAFNKVNYKARSICAETSAGK